MPLGIAHLLQIQQQLGQPLFRVARARPNDSIETEGVGCRGNRRPLHLLVNRGGGLVTFARSRDLHRFLGKGYWSGVQSRELFAQGCEPIIVFSGRVAKNLQQEVAKRVLRNDRQLADVFSDQAKGLLNQLAKDKSWRIALVDASHLKDEFQHDHDYCLGRAQETTIEVELYSLLAQTDFDRIDQPLTEELAHGEEVAYFFRRTMQMLSGLPRIRLGPNGLQLQISSDGQPPQIYGQFAYANFAPSPPPPEHWTLIRNLRLISQPVGPPDFMLRPPIRSQDVLKGMSALIAILRLNNQLPIVGAISSPAERDSDPADQTAEIDFTEALGWNPRGGGSS